MEAKHFQNKDIEGYSAFTLLCVGNAIDILKILPNINKEHLLVETIYKDNIFDLLNKNHEETLLYIYKLYDKFPY